MKKSMSIVFYIGFIFFGGGFLIALGQFILYNRMGDFFEYVEPEYVSFTISSDTVNQKERCMIKYTYIADGKTYTTKETFYASYIKKENKNIEKLYYNTKIPQLIYIEDNTIYIKRSKVNMLIMFIPFLFIYLIYKFADIDKWIGVYTRGEYKSSKND